MDSSQRDVFITEDDQGEGWQDPIEVGENLKDRMQRESWKLQEQLRASQWKERQLV